MKILAIFFIVISHVTQTLTSQNTYVPWNDYVIDISRASLDITNIILLVLRTFGSFGNSVFFISSAWFLLDNDNVSAKKELKMIVDIWSISALLCIVAWFIRYENLSTKLLVKQFFPTLFGNNWYMTCYLLFYPAHKIINKTLNSMTQSEMLRTTSALVMLYIILDYVSGAFFFPSSLILWVTIYFAIAYAKKYLGKSMENLRVNILMIMIGLVGNVGIVAMTDIAGTQINFLQNKTMHWHSDCSPFIIMMAVGFFNLFRMCNLSSRHINYISRLSLFIYIIHENEMLRTYYRPLLWHEIFNRFGYDYLFLWILGLSILVFTFGVVASIIYHYTGEKVTKRITDWLLPKIQQAYALYEKKVLPLN